MEDQKIFGRAVKAEGSSEQKYAVRLCWLVAVDAQLPAFFERPNRGEAEDSCELCLA